MEIAIIGAGNVGGTLGRRFVEAGHEVRFGVRDVKDAKVQALLAKMPGKDRTAASSNAGAAQWAELVVLTTPWNAAQEALAQCGDLAGKLLVDATDPLRLGGGESLEVGFDTSGGEQVAQWAKGAQVFKTFNQVGWEIMANPVLEGRRAVTVVAGPEGEGQKKVLDLVGSIGFAALDIGPLAQARLLEPFGMAWIHTAMGMGLGREWAFSVVRRKG